MRKPDCGIATSRMLLPHIFQTMSEDAKARLWDCNGILLTLSDVEPNCQKMRKPDCGIATSHWAAMPFIIFRVRRCESPIVGLQQKIEMLGQGCVKSQKMRKPDCGIATSPTTTTRCTGILSEDAKARLWDCNTGALFLLTATLHTSEDAKARLWDCNKRDTTQAIPSLRQKMRKPDCGIATKTIALGPFLRQSSEDAKARLWDCNYHIPLWIYIGSIRQKMRKPDCGIATSLSRP